MASLTAASRLGVSAFVESAPVELRQDRRTRTEAELTTAIRAVYRQVLGNEYIIVQSSELKSAESLLRQGELTIRDFVRTVAQSEFYRTKFFYSTQQTRFIELNYKHLLGRAVYDQTEIAFHTALYAKEGYEAEIDSYIDSAEYEASFGDWIVPYYRGFNSQNNQKTVGYNRFFQLYRGYANSDRAQSNSKQSRLTYSVGRNATTPVGDVGQSVVVGTLGGDREQLYRIRVIQRGTGGAVTQNRRSNMEFIVAYSSLSNKLQQLNKRGCTITSITPV
jgi:phycocyanin-associated rod linker protein